MQICIYGDRYFLVHNSDKHMSELYRILLELKEFAHTNKRYDWFAPSNLSLDKFEYISKGCYYISTWNTMILARCQKNLEFMIQVNDNELENIENLLALAKLDPNMLQSEYFQISCQDNFIYTDFIRPIKCLWGEEEWKSYQT